MTVTEQRKTKRGGGGAGAKGSSCAEVKEERGGEKEAGRGEPVDTVSGFSKRGYYLSKDLQEAREQAC